MIDTHLAVAGTLTNEVAFGHHHTADVNRDVAAFNGAWTAVNAGTAHLVGAALQGGCDSLGYRSGPEPNNPESRPQLPLISTNWLLEAAEDQRRDEVLDGEAINCTIFSGVASCRAIDQFVF